MSANGPDPSWQLPLPPDSGPERRRVKPVHLLLGSLLALALLCCGGAAAMEVFTGGKSGKPGTVAIKGPAVPSDEPTTSAATAEVSTSATPSATPTPTTTPRKSSSPRPRPTTPKPTTEPTTRPSTRSPAPTTPPLPIVRPGTFCAPVGALGITARGKLMRCTRLSEDDRPRWRAV